MFELLVTVSVHESQRYTWDRRGRLTLRLSLSSLEIEEASWRRVRDRVTEESGVDTRRFCVRFYVHFSQPNNVGKRDRRINEWQKEHKDVRRQTSANDPENEERRTMRREKASELRVEKEV